MPAKSKAQQRAAGMALSAKRGDMNPDDLKGAAKEMYDSMSEKELEDYAETKHDDLPEKVDESVQLNENALIDKMADIHNIKDKTLLRSLWNKSIDKQTTEGKITNRQNPLFWKGDGSENVGVVNYFKDEIKNLNVEEARMLMDNRNEFKQNSYEFLDALANNDYSKAGESFPRAVQNKVINMINNRKEVYLKQLQKKANDIAKDN